jgi:ABC-2 type transport system permease protein
MPVHTPAAPGPATWRGSRVPTQIGTLTMRSLRAITADRRVVVLGIASPLIMLLVMSQVFGSVANPTMLPAGMPYIDYLVPAILITSGITTAQTAGHVLIRDMNNGVLSRLRALPIQPASLLLARSLADLVRYLVQMTVLLACAILVFGFHPRGGAAGLAGGLFIAALITWAFIWSFVALAVWLRTAEILQNIGIVMFPLMFASSAFAPVDKLPLWLRVVATGNPLTYGINAARALTLGVPSAVAVFAAIAAAALLGGGAALAACLLFRRNRG